MGGNTRVRYEIGRGWSGMDRTRDRVMGLDGNQTKSTISVVGVNTVPIRTRFAGHRAGMRRTWRRG
jgi:hypothetical protein